MNRKKATIVSIILLATFVGTVFADSTTTSTTRTTLQTTSADVGVGGTLFKTTVLVFASSTVRGNLTTAFSFSPSRGFVQVNAVLLTLGYSPANSNTGDQFSIQLNRGSPTLAPVSFAPASGPFSIVTRLQGADLRVGSNVIELGILLASGAVGSSVSVFELRLTVEYTFMA